MNWKALFKEVVERLTSRKLWVALLSAYVFIQNKQYGEAMAVVLAYLAVNGTAEVVANRKTDKLSAQSILDALKASPTVVSDENFEAVDEKGKIVSGRTVYADEDDTTPVK